MVAIKNEIKRDYTFTTKDGVDVTITDVPMRLHKNEIGEEVRGFSIGVALRIEELSNAIVQEYQNPGESVIVPFS
jgi:hypothetical protein